MILCANNNTEALSRPTPAVAVDDLGATKTFIAVEGARVCARAIGYKARSIVLTGSLSRGEATLERDGMGWRVLGDATFLVIHPRPANLRTSQIEAEIESFLASHGITCKIVVVTSTPYALRKMKPQIYAFELRERGIVVWGDQSVLDLMPRFKAAQIPIEDGWWFLSNRMIEQLESATKAKDHPDSDGGIRYRIAKLYLSMAACYLLAIGQYEPSYQDRARRLGELAESPIPHPSPIPLQRFARLVSECTYLKLHGDTAGELDQFPQWRDATSDAEALWLWMLARMVNSNPTISRSELIAILAKRQQWLARAKGWVRAAVVHPAVFRNSWRRWVRLACLGSPRYLVYGAASDLFFHSGDTGTVTPGELAAIADRLPVRFCEGDRQLTWCGVASMIADNFHRFVESTRS